MIIIVAGCVAIGKYFSAFSYNKKWVKNDINNERNKINCVCVYVCVCVQLIGMSLSKPHIDHDN